MSILFQQLFDLWCPPYDPARVPEYLRADPVRAYGIYAFEEGFRLAFQLAASCLDPEDLAKLQ